MLAPPVVRAGVSRHSGRASGSIPSLHQQPSTHRRSYTSDGSDTFTSQHLRPATLPPLSRSSLSSNLHPSSDALLPHPTLLNTPFPSSTDSPDTPLRDTRPYSPFTSDDRRAPSSSSLSINITPPPLPPPPLTSSLPHPHLQATDDDLRLNPFTLQFHHPHYEQQFRLYLEQAQSIPHQLAYTAALVVVGLSTALLDVASVAQGTHAKDAGVRLALQMAALVGIVVMAGVRLLLTRRRFDHRVQLVLTALVMLMAALMALGWTISHDGLDPSSKSGTFMLFLQLLILGRRPLLFPFAVFAGTCCTTFYTTLFVTFPSPSDGVSVLASRSVVLYVSLLWMLQLLHANERHFRLQYIEQLKVALLKKEKDSLDHDTKALKGEFFQLTLERFDIADVEEEGKVLTSAMEQAMGKLQMLGKKQDLPADVLKDIMKVISLLGSGSDLFKAKMEGTEWKNGLYGGDDELTRYIYETLNGETGAGGTNRLTPKTSSSHSTLLSTARLSTDLIQPIDETAPGTALVARSHAHSLSALEVDTRPASPALSSTFLPGGQGPSAAPTAQYDRSLSSLLHQLDDWNLDIFEVATLTSGKPLFFIGMALLKKYNYIDRFELDKLKVSNFLRELEAGYSKSNPYHNSAHAADVARSVHWFVRCGKMNRYCMDLELFALIIASLSHDFQHPGKNNAFCVAAKDERALLYNDRSVLENYHAAQTFLILHNPALNCNFLSPFSSKDFTAIRKLIVGLILATDLAHSNEFLGRFKNWYAAAEATEIIAASAEAAAGVGAGGGGLKGGGVGGGRVALHSSAVKELEYEARVMTMKMALKCADIGHSAKRLALHEKWTARITEEFYRQGDEERKLGLPISPFMDRRKANLSASQLGFMDWIVLPLYTAWFRFLDPEEKRQREMHMEARRRGDAAVMVVGDGGWGGGDGGGMITVMEQLRKNREFWRTWSGPVSSAGGGDTGRSGRESGDEVVPAAVSAAAPVVEAKESRHGSLVRPQSWMAPQVLVGVAEGSAADTGGGGGEGEEVAVAPPPQPASDLLLLPMTP